MTKLNNFTVNKAQTCFIEDLCWVLDPVKMFPKLNGGKSWAEHCGDNKLIFRRDTKTNNFEGESEATKQFHTQVEIAGYFAEQIYLYSSLCLGRSYNCILELSKEISYEMCVQCGCNRALPDRVRAAFIGLLRRLWIDRYPHGPNCGRPSLPDLIWVSSELKKTSIAGGESQHREQAQRAKLRPLRSDGRERGGTAEIIPHLKNFYTKIKSQTGRILTQHAPHTTHHAPRTTYHTPRTTHHTQ